jgi:CheY-like chemotaxis protein
LTGKCGPAKTPKGRQSVDVANENSVTLRGSVQGSLFTLAGPPERCKQSNDVGNQTVYMPLITVLVVDDDDSVQFFLERAVRKAKVPLSFCRMPSGERAIAYLLREGEFRDTALYPVPSLILLDINMPGLSGFDVLQWKREQSELASIPVIMFSSSELPKDKQRAFESGAVDYLVKPLGAEEMVPVINRIWNYCLESAAARKRADDRGAQKNNPKPESAD